MTEPRDRLGHSAEDYRAKAAERRLDAKHYGDGNLPGILWNEHQADRCELAAEQLEGTQ